MARSSSRAKLTSVILQGGVRGDGITALGKEVYTYAALTYGNGATAKKENRSGKVCTS